MKKLIIMAALLTSATAQAQQAWNLRQCINYAIEHNIQIKQRKNMCDQREIALSTARNRRLPDLNGSASHSFNFGRGLTVDNTYVDQNTQNTQFGLNTSIPLFTGFEIPNTIALNRLNLQAAVADLEKAKEDISIQVTQAYLQVLFNEEMCRVADRQVELSQAQLARVQGFFDNGKKAESELMEAKATVAQDEYSAVENRNALQLSTLSLTQLLELPTPEGFDVVTPETPFGHETLSTPDEVYALAAASRPQILAEQYRLEGTKHSIKIAQSGLYPQLSVGGGLSTSYYKTNGYDAHSFGRQMGDNFNKYVGFTLSIPIFNRLATRNNIRNAKVDSQNQQLMLDDAKKSLYKEIQQAYYNAVAAQNKYQSSMAAQASTASAFQLMEQKYLNGKASETEYKEVKTNLFKADSEMSKAKYDYLFRVKILDFYKGVPIELK